MKTFLLVNVIFSLILTSMLWSCNEVNSGTNVAPCANKDGLIKVSTLENVSDVIKKTDLYQVPDDDGNFYVIQEITTSEFGNQLPLHPCNLPSDFEVENLIINFSGNLFKTKNWGLEDHVAQPFEFTSIDYLEKK